MKNLDLLSKFTGRASNQQIQGNIDEGVSLNITDLAILICAIIIACVGLNMNASAVIIGAMLISPIMGPIIGIGYGIGTYDVNYIKKAAKLLLIEIIISIITATIYFKITPITGAGSQILSRTTPTIWDVIIAFVGGTAGIIGLSRKKAGNVLPGVAIATALMPPLCTAGYGIARWNMHIFLGAGYLFLINSFFICISTLIVVKLLKMPKHTFVDAKKERNMKTAIIVCTIIVIIPSMISAGQMINTTLQSSNLNNFITNEISTASYVLDKSVNTTNDTIHLVLVGNPISQVETTALDKKLDAYGFKGYKLDITQNSDLNIKSYFDKIENKTNGLLPNASAGASQTTKENSTSSSTAFEDASFDKVSNELKALFPGINKVIMGTGEVSLNTEKVEASTKQSLDSKRPDEILKNNSKKIINESASKDNKIDANALENSKVDGNKENNTTVNEIDKTNTSQNLALNTAEQKVLMVSITTDNDKISESKANIENYLKERTGYSQVLVSIDIIKKDKVATQKTS